ISIRGIESNPFIVNRTAVYVDGIPYRDPDMLRLHNVNQIEILRGPQGTLYGSNANAGIIVISTKTPYQELESSFGLSVNS
ncbi:TonB-dependent receptor, partial [Pseudoalteromonas sp. S3178]